LNSQQIRVEIIKEKCSEVMCISEASANKFLAILFLLLAQSIKTPLDDWNVLDIH